jgi:phenylacetate-CoA ligase
MTRNLDPSMMAPRSHMTGIRWPAISSPQGAHILALLFQLEQSQWWPPERLLAHQLLQAQSLIEHAAATVPFYRERLAPATGLEAGTLSLEAFRRIPVMRRTDIQDAGEDFFSQAFPPEHGETSEVRTSGSTGRPITIKWTAVTGLFLQALTLRGHLWHKRDLSAKNVTFRLRVPEDHDPARSSWAAGYATGPSRVLDVTLPMGELFDHLMAEDPEYLQAHASAIMGLIERSQETGTRPGRLREVRSLGEVLTPQLRDLCRSAWGVPITDIYSANETGTIAHQCPDHAHYHVQAESVLVEVLDDAGNPCGPGETGRVVITVLHNFATPLIRYDIGDYAEAGGPCPCGRGLPVLNRITGRVRNLVVLPDGGTVYSAIFEMPIASVAPVRQFQLVQKTPHDIEVTLAVERPLNRSEETDLEDYFTKCLGHSFDYRFRYVDEIPRSPAGKYEAFRSEIAGRR